jgi:hypothetical protein
MAPSTDNLGAFRKGVIVSIQDGPPKTCTINLSGDSTDIPNIYFLESYSPIVGDTVIIGKQDGSLLILGTLADRPPTQPTLLLKRSANQAIVNSTDTAVSWDTEIRTVGGPASWWDSANATRIVCPWVGLYRVRADVTWQANANLRRALHLNLGDTIANANYIASDGWTAVAADDGSRYQGIDRVIDCTTAGQIYKIIVWQNSGTSLNLETRFAVPPATVSFTYLGTS